MPVIKQQLDLTKFYQLDDFTGGRYDTGVWSAGTSGSGSTIAKISGLGGQIQLTAGAANGRSAQLSHGSIYNFSLDKKGVIRFRAKLSAVTNVLFNVGFMEGNSYNSWALFTLESSVSSYWQTRTRNAGTNTNNTSAVLGDTNWHLFEIFTFPTEVIFLLDGILLFTHTTNLPLTTLMPYIYVSSLSSSARSAKLDWIEMFGDRQ